MKPFSTLDSAACPLALANIDTDQIMPARFMRRPRDEGGYGQYLFHDLRRDTAGERRPEFPLNRAVFGDASIIIARSNFGCGSSREPAVYALVDHGIRCVIAPSFGDIFASNAVRNGLLPAVVSEAEAETLLACSHVESGARLQIDLNEQTITAGNLKITFDIAPSWKARLLNGWDDVDLTLSHGREIRRFSETYQRQYPWASPRRQTQC